MKLKDIKIGTQLWLSQGVILALVVSFGVFAWNQGHQIWSGTETMYNHPVKVRTAIGALQADILNMRLEFRDLLLAADDSARQRALANSEVHRNDARRQFIVLRERYLGPPEDIDDAEDAFEMWVAVRESNLALAQTGKVTEAMNRVAESGDIGMRRRDLTKAVQRVDDFANSQAQLMFQKATVHTNIINQQLLTVVAAALLLSLGIGGMQLKQIRTPLASLTATAQRFRQGHFDLRSEYVSANEFGALSAAFNSMAEEIESRAQLAEDAAQLSDLMLREEDIHVFCRQLLSGLLAHTGSQVGAVYFENEAKTAFVLFESIGLSGGGRAAFASTELEGELGMALANRQIQHITNIPADTRFTFAAASGDFAPREILTIPVVSGASVVAIISLASVRPYEPQALRLVDKIWSVLTARLNGVLAFQKTQYFADQLEAQNHELEAQKRELAAQADELTEQNTELEMQKHQLSEANRLKSAFLSNMSHELRTPLNSVIALSGVLHRRLADTLHTEEHGYLEIIERNGMNLLELINNILDLSRIEAGREEVHASRFAVHEWVEEVVEMLQPQALENDVDLSNQVDRNLPWLESDRAKCRHILQNLVGNAIKFTEHGNVAVAAQMDDVELRLTVSDTGIGISPSQLPYIFDEFRQADDGTSRKYGGTGLGLAIARKYAELLGGGITATSVPGSGSVFTLRLPLAGASSGEPGVAEPVPLPVARLTPAAVPPGRGQKILLVEDNDPAIIQLTEILQAHGYYVRVARDGRQALAVVGEWLPDAMILDLMMPEVDGFQVLQSLRAQPRTADVPVLILTAKHVTKEELSVLRGNHIHQLIQKGDINKDGLLAAVAGMVESVAAPQPAALAVVNTMPVPAAVDAPLVRRRPNRPGRPVVVVVEDNPDNLQTVVALLADGYLTITAENGLHGLEQAREHQPDLILTDISMPVMDGFAVLAAIRSDDSLRDIPVVAVTASAMKGNREEILSHGFDGYISKPIDHGLLVETLDHFLAPAAAVRSTHAS